MKVRVEVIHPIAIPAGEYLDGALVASRTWAMKGLHEIEFSLLAASQWEQRGYVDPISVDGTPIFWNSCCADSSH